MYQFYLNENCTKGEQIILPTHFYELDMYQSRLQSQFLVPFFSLFNPSSQYVFSIMSSDKYNVLIVRLNGKNYSAWAFQFEIVVTEKKLWGHIVGIDSALEKTQKDAHAKWEVKDTQVKAWILGSIDPHIILGLRPFTTTSKM